jgi:hypothetical protein
MICRLFLILCEISLVSVRASRSRCLRSVIVHHSCELVELERRRGEGLGAARSTASGPHDFVTAQRPAGSLHRISGPVKIGRLLKPYGGPGGEDQNSFALGGRSFCGCLPRGSFALAVGELGALRLRPG